MSAQRLAQVIGSQDVRSLPGRESPWLAIGDGAHTALQTLPEFAGRGRPVLFASGIHRALEMLFGTAVAGCLVETRQIDDRPEAALDQLRRALGSAPLVLLGATRRRATQSAADSRAVPLFDPVPERAAQTAALAPSPQTASLPDPELSRFVDGCLARVARPAALRRYVLGAFVALSGAKRASLMLREARRERLRLATVQGFERKTLVGRAHVALGAGVAGRVAASGQIVADRGTPGGARGYAGSGYVVIPLGTGRRCQGVVNLTGLPADALPDRATLAQWTRFGRRAATALRHARRLRRLERLATHDTLTGLPNRRSFERALRRELDRAGRAGTGLGVAMIDIDHFKSVNDDLGHQAGDLVLIEVAQRLDAAFRETDLVCRWGGEEFAVLLPGVSPQDPKDAERAAERARRAVAKRSLLVGKPARQRQVTVSVGFAVWPEIGPDGVRLLAAADKAMYAAKRAGRNRVRRARRRA